MFLNPGEEVCLQHCRSRPWEPHKYESKAAQDERLALLLPWVTDYYRRTDGASLVRHRAIFDRYDGPKHELTDEAAAARYAPGGWQDRVTRGSP